MDRIDASVGGDAGNVKITCEFSDLPESLIVDADNPTTLAGEYLLNESGNLEITKTYNAALASPKVSNICANALPRQRIRPKPAIPRCRQQRKAMTGTSG